MAFIGLKPLLLACLGATHSPQASPRKEAVRAPALRLSYPHVLSWIDSLILLEQEGRPQTCENLGGLGVAQQPSPTLDGENLLPPHFGWGGSHCHFGTICSSVPSWSCFSLECGC